MVVAGQEMVAVTLTVCVFMHVYIFKEFYRFIRIMFNLYSIRIKCQQGSVNEDLKTELITSSVAAHYWEF